VTKVTKIYAWGHQKRYNDFSNHFKILFKERIQKVSVDAGFTCPNRDGLKGLGGVLFAITKHLILPIANSRRVLVPSLERESLFFGENTIQ